MSTPEQPIFDPNNRLVKERKPKPKIAKMSWLLLFVGLAALAFAIYIMQNSAEEEPV